MKASRYWGSLMLCALLLFPFANVDAAGDAAAGAKLPSGVSVYAHETIDNGQKCLVGAKSDQDGLNERPVVYLADATGGFTWHASLKIPADTYQGRATHCVASPAALFVLVQVDTQSEQSLSQTLLKVVKLDRKTGAVLATKDVAVPGVSAAYSASVDEGGDNFKAENGSLVIKGSYELMSDRDNNTGNDPTNFTVKLPMAMN
ncbi:hypothetical protein [Dyella nitratireducens]|uniref:Uncharacterized protein n=1 Tax=Dyella nitratireducens TaxID=1849580 RepID=A0ABQ1G7Z4_9GAMM|nr:hypothetical protein [Dyella nitratireducens]GGA38529.1 hypothetical protein GCM10010981_29700 [Dyella nitratireducens]GLQ40327.1 hypothetical protein GCM10007902_01760 [Dyella nitratireducens]